MKRIVLACLVSLVLALASPGYALAAPHVRVGLVWDLAGKDYLGFEVVQGSYSLLADGKAVRSGVGAGTAFRAGSGPWGLVLFIQGQPEGFVHKIQLEPVNGKLPVFKLYSDQSSKKYRGSLEITRKPDGTLLVVNTLGEQEYLYGVVPMEMSNSWAAQGFEALKAQAVAARTYLHSHYDTGLSKGYNISDSPNLDQAYAGYSVEGAASRAVDVTAGEILVDRISRKPINASYHSNSGGYTEDSENVWGGTDPHLRGKPDPYSLGQGFFADKWEFTASGIALGRPLGLGPVTDVKLEKFPSGRVKKVVLTDVTGRSVSKTGRQFVTYFYPKGRAITDRDFLSNLFSVQVLAKGSDSLLVPNPVEYLIAAAEKQMGPRLDLVDTSVTPPNSRPSPYPVYLFSGGGWGHGVGMSQWGAYGMARKGYSYSQILEYYYSNVSISKAK